MNEVPWLRSGVGQTPQDGGCIMQVIDWIDRNEWTDSPPCVHPVLRRIAIQVNDSADDVARQRLLDLAPRLMGTASDDRVLAVRLAVFCARWVLPVFEERHPGDGRPRLAIETAEAWCESQTPAAASAAASAASAAADAASYAAGYAAAARAASASYAAGGVVSAAAAASYAAGAAGDAAAASSAAAASYDLLAATLDEYDRLTGRGAVCPVDLAPAARAMWGRLPTDWRALSVT